MDAILDWAFQRHLNPLSWYIRPVMKEVIAGSREVSAASHE